jgi:hypothetical protein
MLDLVLLTSNHMLRLTNENENEASFSFSSRTITCNFYRNFVVHMSTHTRQNESFSSSNRKKRPDDDATHTLLRLLHPPLQAWLIIAV